MASYVVMEPPAEADRDDAVFVRDGFHFFAFLVPFLWLFWHRLWIEGLLALVAAVAIGWLSGPALLGSWAMGLSLVISIYVGIEGPALRQAALRRRGWREWGVVEADNAAEAELRYLGEDKQVTAPPAGEGPWDRADRTRPTGPRHTPPALGLLDYPDGRR